MLLLLAACKSNPNGDAAPAPERKRGTIDEFERLLQQESLRPVQAMPVEPGTSAPGAGAGDPFAPLGDLTPELGTEFAPETASDPLAPLSAGGPPPTALGAGAGEPSSGGVAAVGTQNPYVTFGPRIIPHADGRITKPFPLPPGRGRALLELMALYGDFPLVFSVREKNAAPASPPEPNSNPEQVEAILLKGWDTELYQDLRVWPPVTATDEELADWLVITAQPELLLRVEDFINLFAAGVPQIEIEAKIVEITETEGLDLGIKPVTGKPIFDAPGDGTAIKSFDYNFGNLEDAEEALLTIGAVQNGLAFNAVLEAVASWENVSINSQPKIAVREGSRADIVNTQDIPFYSFNNLTATGGYTAGLAFKEVGIKLYIVPRVVGTQTVALNIDIEASQQIGTSISFITEQGGELSTPIIAKRAARTIVYLQPGQAVILGGLTTERDAEAIDKVPFLGDIPFLGALFRSKNTRKERTHVLFFIRPRILQGIEFTRDF